MKKSLLLLLSIVSLACTQLHARTLKATIKPGSAANKVDIYIRPDFTDNTQFIRNLILTMAIPLSQSTNVTATITPAASGITPLSYNPASPETIGSERVYAFNGTANSGTMTFTNGVEILAATVTFSGGGSANAQVKVADFTGAGSGSSGLALFYSELNVNGDITPVNNGGTSLDNFYASSGQSTTGTTTANSSSNNGFARTINNVALPINLLSFNAQQAGDHRSLISWTAASEAGTSSYEIERATAGNSTEFQSLNLRVPAKGTTSVTDYQVYDEAPAAGANYYRLKIVAVNGTVTYSPTQVVRFAKGFNETISLFPNPLAANASAVKLAISTETAQTVNYTLLDITGKRVSAGALVVTVGHNEYTVAGFDGLAAGNYLLQVQGTTLSETIKVEKK